MMSWLRNGHRNIKEIPRRKGGSNPPCSARETIQPRETYTELTDAPRDANGRFTVKPQNLLVNVPLGKASLLDVVRVLSSYNPATVPVSEAKLAVLKILLMIPESLRFHPVRNAYILRGHTEESHLTEAVTNYVPKWPLISKLLMEWDRYDSHQPYH
ncbi:hypothetical protein BRADI_4g41509v3 [Brachypodium distachyon]|uniref:rRNA N-glycosylase n=1 Tax=Brachypodium distachyon TaxID=15368 RepID=A0A2K2CTM6_BRADI|nr:hypothetical protein BRADI_4g41509v3 [Brachypodium distachyon]